jgi:hypothetical protein
MAMPPKGRDTVQGRFVRETKNVQGHIHKVHIASIDKDRSQDTSDPNRRDLKLGLDLENIAFDLDPNMSNANYKQKA